MTENGKINVLIKEVWKLICSYGNHIQDRIMFNLIDQVSKQILSQFGQINPKIYMIFSFVTIPCPSCNVITQIT